MKLQQIRIERSAFDRITADERTLLVLLAHVANELNVLVRVIPTTLTNSTGIYRSSGSIL